MQRQKLHRLVGRFAGKVCVGTRLARLMMFCIIPVLSIKCAWLWFVSIFYWSSSLIRWQLWRLASFVGVQGRCKHHASTASFLQPPVARNTHFRGTEPWQPTLWWSGEHYTGKSPSVHLAVRRVCAELVSRALLCSAC